MRRRQFLGIIGWNDRNDRNDYNYYFGGHYGPYNNAVIIKS
jgi:hypothetical protein